MLYYRVAYQVEETQSWKWKSTSVTSLNALLNLLRSYNAIPQERIRVFMATSKDYMDEMLQRQNQGLLSTSVPADQITAGGTLNNLEVARMELELGAAGDHDEPYVFSVPLSVKEMARWIDLRRYVLEGDLVS
ncbi:MAG TPA: hypothetical protein VL485_13045 [Ktedonobacteraceae bacterium]|nr:hypothetical protein [Ktedonobacteraceae bacterium]